MSSQNNGSRLVRKYYSRTQQMEIVIETLSGTAFEMTVLPSETIFSIKAKIQRVEGIPIAHQHLIHNMRELQNDDATLADCGLRNGSRLRLVLSLRGGPISTRRLPLLSCSDAESDQDIGFEPIPSGSHIVLLMQDGEQLSLFKVVENEDGTFSPMNESWLSRKQLHAAADEVDDGELDEEGEASFMESRARENAATRSKVRDLRVRMEQLALQKKLKKPQEVPVAKLDVAAALPPPPPLPAVAEARSFPMASSSSLLMGGSRREWTRHLPSLTHVQPPPLTSTHPIELQPTLRPMLPPLPSTRPLPPLATQRGRAGRAKDTVRAAPTTLAYECIQSDASMPSSSSVSTTSAAVELQARSHPVRQTHLSHFVLDNRPKTSPEKLYVVNHSLAQEIQKETKEMCRILGEVRRRHWSQEMANRTEMPRTSPPPLLPQAVPQLVPAEPEPSADPESGSSTAKPRRPRCSQCRRKLNITNAHTCRCGKQFCASHRYAETHNCTYDYKADGKKILAQNNPLVVATKLPKI